MNDLPLIFREALKLRSISNKCIGKRGKFEPVFVFEKGNIFNTEFLFNIIYSEQFVNKYGRVNQNLSDIEDKIIVCSSKHERIKSFDCLDNGCEIFNKDITCYEVMSDEAKKELVKLINNKFKFNNVVTRQIYGDYIKHIITISNLYANDEQLTEISKDNVLKAKAFVMKLINEFDKMFNENDETDLSYERFLHRFFSYLKQGLTEKELKDKMRDVLGRRGSTRVLLMLRNLEMIDYFVDKETNEVIIKSNDNLKSIDLLRKTIKQ